MLKIIVDGAGGSGKGNFIRICGGQLFTDQHIQTIGVDFTVVTLQCADGTSCRVQIWQFCGGERFRAITKLYYKGAHSVIIMFALNCRSSFEYAEQQILTIKRTLEEQHQYQQLAQMKIMLVGNKSDLEPAVSREEIDAVMRRHEIRRYEEISLRESKGKHPLQILRELADSRDKEALPAIPVEPLGERLMKGLRLLAPILLFVMLLYVLW